MIKILHICTDSNIGGAIVTLYRIVKAADKTNFEHLVLIPHSSMLYDDFVALGVHVIPLKTTPDRSFSICAMLECLRYIRDHSPHIVHTHGAIFGRLAAYLSGIRSRIYTRHTYDNKRYSLFLRLINRTITTNAVAVSSAVVDQIIACGIRVDQISVIENGCPQYISSANLKDRKFKLLYLGRLEREKGLLLALEGIRELHGIDPRYTLTLVGEGNYRQEIESIVSLHGMSDYVKVYPAQKDVASFLSEHGIAINCSYENEATSNFLIEAMSASMVCVLSDVGGNKAIIHDGVDGRLFESGDSNAFLNAVMDATDKYAYYSPKSSENYLCRFNEEIMINKYQALWNEEYDRFYFKE